MRFDDPTGDRETQPGSAAFEFDLAAGVQIRPPELTKFLEDDGLIFI
jgi:hypothetical protein